jgi:hypothetical protein
VPYCGLDITISPSDLSGRGVIRRFQRRYPGR